MKLIRNEKFRINFEIAYTIYYDECFNLKTLSYKSHVCLQKPASSSLKIQTAA